MKRITGRTLTVLVLIFLGVGMISASTILDTDYIDIDELRLAGTNITERLIGNFTGLGLIGDTLNTGQGAYELYAMDQDVQTTDAVTFSTVDTGQGATEVHLMDQDLQTTDTPTFSTITTSGDSVDGFNLTKELGGYKVEDLADHGYHGDYIQGQAGENLVIGDIVYLASDGDYEKADANSSSTMYACGIVTETINSGNWGYILVDGYIRDDTWSGWTIGTASPLYVSGTEGSLTQSAPNSSGDQVQIVGYAIASKIIRFDPDSTVVEIS